METLLLVITWVVKIVLTFLAGIAVYASWWDRMDESPAWRHQSDAVNIADSIIGAASLIFIGLIWG